jgi:NADH:ubiquinone oxidoreductase subunit 5 (subunit L)/multisubunit Na+/H+ antiporter MnhA subunit
MEAPVPASALIHSATLVSAGVFLVLRLTPLFEISTLAYFILPVIGSLTAAYGGFVAMFTSDIKRILAYSTISHCGFLMVMCSTFVNEFTIIYLYVHGFFKASVFLCVGNVIRFSKNYQDFRYMGGLYKYMPFDCILSFICLFNLAGLPFGLGFYIKHLLFLSLKINIYLYYIVLFNCILGAIAGLFYSYRLFYNAFFDYKKGKEFVYQHTNSHQLNSRYYSNSSFASNASIFLLVLVSYIVSFYLLYIFLNFNSTVSDFNNNYYATNSFNFFFDYTGMLFNISFFNYLIIFLAVMLIFYTGRNTYNSHKSFERLAVLFVFVVFFLLFNQLLS